MKEPIIGTIIVLLAIWGGAYGITTLTGLYAGAAYLTAWLVCAAGITIGLKGLK